NRVFEAYLLTGEIEPGNSYIYDELFRQKKLPFHSKEFKERIRRKAIRNLYRTKEGSMGYKKYLREIQNGHKAPVAVECKYIIMKMYFSHEAAKRKKTDPS